MKNNNTLTPNKKNIGIVTTWFDRGASFVSNAYFETLCKDNNVFIYARGNDRTIKIDQRWDKEYVTWGKIPYLDIPTFIIWSDFKQWIEKNDIEIVFFNEQHSWDVIIKCQNLNVLTGAYIDYYTPQTIPFFHLYDFLICNTKRHYSVFKHHPQCFYIPWGTDCELFRPQDHLKTSGGITFFHSCGMSPYRKGTDILIRAFKDVKGNAKLIIHSQINFENSEILRLISDNSRIQIIVKTVPPPGLFFLGDVYVYPTRIEGIGLTILEALSCGLPVITTDNAPMNEFVENGRNGFLIGVEKYQKRSDGYFWQESICEQNLLTERMQYCVDYPEEINKLKVYARNHAEQYLSWEKNSATLSSLIHSSRKIEKSRKILLQAAYYEYHRYPLMVLSALRRKIYAIRKPI